MYIYLHPQLLWCRMLQAYQKHSKKCISTANFECVKNLAGGRLITRAYLGGNNVFPYYFYLKN